MEPDMDFEFILARHYAELDRQDQYTDALTLPVGALPVVSAGRVVGILGEIDVLKTFAQALGQGFSKPARWAWAFR